MGVREDLKRKYAASRKTLGEKYRKSEGALVMGALLGAAGNGAMEGYGLGFTLGTDDAGQPRSLGWGAVAGPLLLATNGMKQGSFVKGIGLGMTCAQVSDFVEDTVFSMTGGKAAMQARREDEAAGIYMLGREEGAVGSAAGVPSPAAVVR